MESEPNFESYSREELLEIYEAIDRNAYPERFEKVKALLGFKDAKNIAFHEDNEDVEIDPAIAELNKTRRIKEYFDSLEENDTSIMSSHYGGSDGDAGGIGGDCNLFNKISD